MLKECLARLLEYDILSLFENHSIFNRTFLFEEIEVIHITNYGIGHYDRSISVRVIRRIYQSIREINHQVSMNRSYVSLYEFFISHFFLIVKYYLNSSVDHLWISSKFCFFQIINLKIVFCLFTESTESQSDDSNNNETPKSDSWVSVKTTNNGRVIKNVCKYVA